MRANAAGYRFWGSLLNLCRDKRIRTLWLLLQYKKTIMKKIIILLVLAVLGVATYYFWVTKPKPNREAAFLQSPAQSSHDPAFNQSVDSVLNAYYALSDAFVNWDSLRVAAHAAQLQERLDDFSIKGLKGDTVIYQSVQPALESARKEAKAVSNATGLAQKRKAFHVLSQNLFGLLIRL